LFRDIFGEEAVSTRLVFGFASLPVCSSVGVEVFLDVNA